MAGPSGLVLVGTCGWSVRGGKRAYFSVFRVVELQETFYKLPRVETARRWREMAPPDFEYAVKAWQVITHPPTSPTWRRAGISVPSELRDRYGYLRPTEENLRAWEEVLSVCRALRAAVCVLQTPPSFGYSPEAEASVEAFFSTVRRDGVRLAWEPRGTWHEHPEAVRRICSSLDVVHVVDVLRRRPAFVGDLCYFRLHGLGGREVNYRYKYTDEDLARLASVVGEYAKLGCRVYVLFNNVFMRDDAVRFREIARGAGLEVV